MHTVKLNVRTYECDAYGHANNAVFLNYLEFARDQWIADLGLDYQGLIAAGSGILVAEANLVYQSPALPNEELTIETRTKEAGAAWVLVSQTILGPQDRPVLEAQMKLVWVGATGRPTRIPAEWRERLFRAI